MTDFVFQTVAETQDRHGGKAWIVFETTQQEWWWKMEGELEGPFDTREDAERDLASR